MIDTHAHIDDPQYEEDFDEFIKNQQEGGVEMILVPGVNVESISSVPAVCARYPDYCLPAIGLHPEEVKSDFKDILQQMYDALDNHHWIAIGEIGLDYHFSTEYKEEQKIVFREQLQWALDRNLPVMIHSRDATEDCLQILKEYTSKGLQGVMHCFSGSRETATEVVKMGLYLGIGGVITFKNAKLAENLKDIPLERILTETDLPYMAPVPFRGKRNESRWMSYVIERLGEVYNLSFEQIDRQTTLNARRLFKLQ